MNVAQRKRAASPTCIPSSSPSTRDARSRRSTSRVNGLRGALEADAPRARSRPPSPTPGRRARRATREAARSSPSRSRSRSRAISSSRSTSSVTPWFGDYVTTAWWDDTWLNEGLTAWVDAKITSEKIRQPVVSKGDIQSSFDSAITYLKGARVVTMLEAWMGPGAHPGDAPPSPRAARLEERDL